MEFVYNHKPYQIGSYELKFVEDLSNTVTVIIHSSYSVCNELFADVAMELESKNWIRAMLSAIFRHKTCLLFKNNLKNENVTIVAKKITGVSLSYETDTVIFVIEFSTISIT